MTIVNKYKKHILIIVLIAISFVLGKYTTPSKVETIEVEKIVEVVKEQKDKKEAGIVHEKELRRTDGTVEIERTRIYANHERTATESNRVQETYKSTKTETLPNHQVSIMYQLHSKDDNTTNYKVAYQTRILSSLYAGAYVVPDSKLEYGIIISLGF